MDNTEPKSIDQISMYLKEHINNDTKIQIANFAILWNCFEKTCVDRNLCKEINDVDVIDFKRVINVMRMTNDDHKYIDQISRNLKDHLMKDMYIRYTINDLCNYFKVSDNLRKEIRDYELLSDDSDDRRQDLEILLIITKRVRNNMYHGGKDIKTLDSQIDLFKVCNSLLVFVLYKLGCKDIFKI